MSDKKDMVNHPSHYNVGKFETIEVIEDWKLNFHIGNAVKYLSRAGHKGDEVEDLQKAIWYINRRIQLIKTGEFEKKWKILELTERESEALKDILSTLKDQEIVRICYDQFDNYLDSILNKLENE